MRVVVVGYVVAAVAAICVDHILSMLLCMCPCCCKSDNFSLCCHYSQDVCSLLNV